jgi:flagellar basal-body rod protein FlgB
MKTLFEPHMSLCSKVMDLRLKRQNLVIGNITNANTPGYKPRRLDFEAKLQASLDLDAKGTMQRTESGHMPSTFEADGFSPDFEKEFKPRTEHGQDSVDLDKEMAIMSKNSLSYDVLTTIVREGFKGVNKVITQTSK